MYSIVINTIVKASMDSNILPFTQKDIYPFAPSPPPSPLTEVVVHGFDKKYSLKDHRGATAPRIF